MISPPRSKKRERTMVTNTATCRSTMTKSSRVISALLLTTYILLCNYRNQYYYPSSVAVNAFIVPSKFTSSFKIQSAMSVEPHAELKGSRSKEKNEVTSEDDERDDLKGETVLSATNDNGPDDDFVEKQQQQQQQQQEQPRKFSKLLRLKDRMWVREALEDLTAAEFACNLAVISTEETTSTSSNSISSNKSKKGSVDFENLLAKLDKRIEDMCVKSTYGNVNSACITSYPFHHNTLSSPGSADVTASDLSDAIPGPDDECWSLMENHGMGSVTYTDDQRSALVLRLLASRQELIKVMTGEANTSDSKTNSESSSAAKNLDQIREKLQTPDNIEEDNTNNPNNNKSKMSSTSGPGPYLYVRDDGTIDWDGALQDRAALKNFGISVWARINGQDPESIDEDSVQDGNGGNESHGGQNKVTVKIVETDAIREKKTTLDKLKLELNFMEKEHTALLNSAVSAGSAVANVNLARLEPELRTTIRASDNELKKKKDEVSFATLIYELERIYTYLDGELGNTATKGYIPLQDRLNVAEFGLLESQICSMKNQIENGEIVDADVLAVVLEQTTDFKRRLGIDYYVTGLTFDQEGIKIWFNDLLTKSKQGLAFYGKGIQLFFNDLVFSSSLIGKALSGYTLKPREVNTLRRTFKDVITFIPVVIILIIPLSPVGHVLVFGAIQRFFPDFFPSCFTESRQNLLSLYQSTEYSEITIEENWQEKSIRVLEAAGYFLVDNTKKLFRQLTDEDETNIDKH